MVHQPASRLDPWTSGADGGEPMYVPGWVGEASAAAFPHASTSGALGCIDPTGRRPALEELLLESAGILSRRLDLRSDVQCSGKIRATPSPSLASRASVLMWPSSLRPASNRGRPAVTSRGGRRRPRCVHGGGAPSTTSGAGSGSSQSCKAYCRHTHWRSTVLQRRVQGRRRGARRRLRGHE